MEDIYQTAPALVSGPRSPSCTVNKADPQLQKRTQVRNITPGIKCDLHIEGSFRCQTLHSL